RLEQAELPTIGDLPNAADHLAIVDSVLEPVRSRGVRNLEPDVEDERLRMSPFRLLDSVLALELEPVELDRDAHPATTAWAAVRASTCSRTSCTRKTDAPRS